MLNQGFDMLNLRPKSFYGNIYDILIMNRKGNQNSKKIYCPARCLIYFLVFNLVFLFPYCFFSHDAEPFPVCGSQVDKVFELIKIHTDHVNGLRDNILWTRQAFFLVMTGLMAYYLKGNGIRRKKEQNNQIETKNQLETLRWLLFFAMILCYLNEGVLNYWQAQHLNKIYQLEEGLEAELFPWHTRLQETFIWIKLPNCGETLNMAIFVLGLWFHPASSVFYFGTFIILLLALRRVEKGWFNWISYSCKI